VSNLWQQFELTVRWRAAAPALVFPEQEVSFAELRDDAIRCAAWLARMGVHKGSTVALQLPKRRETYALWLACLRQGAIYVFLDPRNPAERTSQILDRVKPALFVSVVDSGNPFGHTLTLGSEEAGRNWLRGLAAGDAPEPARVHGLDPAYIMFTSGSTGEPKGAVIPHQGVLSLMRWARGLCEPDTLRFSNVNPLHFDNSVFDIYCGLLSGAALVPVETGTMPNPAHWVKRLREGGANVVFAVPTLFQTLAKLNLLKPANLPDARLFVFGGEGFPPAELRAFRERFESHVRLLNVYGPTETSCICSSLEIDQAAIDASGGGLASLGRMHEDFDHVLLDEAGIAVPRGSVGELWIGGANVGLGYYANPQETERRFRQDPRQTQYRSIWYRSGDLVREDEEGLLWFQGRADNQVKVRGHRIELEEVDLALQGMNGIIRAVATLVDGSDGPEIRAAFAAREPIPVEQVRAHCVSKLPSYMQPARIVQLDALPVNANGKVDRRAAAALLKDPA